MINRGQCFVRALDENDKWGAVDVLDLDDESFRRFVVSKMADMGIVTIIVKEDQEPEPLRKKKP